MAEQRICKNILILSNADDMKVSFINFFANYAKFPSAEEVIDAGDFQCPLPCRVMLAEGDFCKLGKEEVSGVNKPIECELDVGDRYKLKFFAIAEEKNSWQWNKLIAKCSYVNAIVILVNPDAKFTSVVNSLETLTRSLEKSTLKRITFITTGDKCPGMLDRLNIMFGCMLNTTFNINDIILYPQEAFKHLTHALLGVGQLNESSYEMARICCDKLVERVVVHENRFASVFFLGKPLKMLQELFELLGHAFVAVEENIQLVKFHDVTEQCDSTSILLVFLTRAQTNGKPVMVCYEAECPDAIGVNVGKDVNIVCSSSTCCEDLSTLICSSICQVCECPVSEHYFGPYVKRFEDTQAKVSVPLFERIRALIVKTMANISIFRHQIMKCPDDPHLDFLQENANRDAKSVQFYRKLLNHYRTEMEIRSKLSLDIASCLAECFEELANLEYVKDLIGKTYQMATFFHLKGLILKMSRKQTATVQSASFADPQAPATPSTSTQTCNLCKRDIEKSSTEASTSCANPTSSNDADSKLENLRLLALLRETVESFTEEMSDLRNICRMNESLIKKMAADLGGSIAKIGKDVEELKNRLDSGKSDSCCDNEEHFTVVETKRKGSTESIDTLD